MQVTKQRTVKILRNADALLVCDTRKPSKRELLVAMRVHRAPLPAGFKFDREEANTR